MTGELAEQVLDLAGSNLPGAEIEVRVQRMSAALTRFANSFIHQNVEEDSTSIRLGVHRAGRTVVVRSTLPDLAALVDRAAAMLESAPRDAGWPGLTTPAALGVKSIVDEATRDNAPADRAARVRDFASAAEDLSVAGYCRTTYWTGAFRNSAGQALDAAVTDASMDGIARVSAGDGVARRSGHRLSDLDGAALGAQAAASARSQVDPVELPAGRYEVVLLPDAVTDLLNNLAMFGFNGKAFTEGRSFAVLGEAQFARSISIFDDPFDGAGGMPFDAEGTPKTRLALVDGGVTKSVTHDRRTAGKAGAVSTGHATGDVWGPMAFNPALGPGDTTTEEMISRMSRGILVADLWYTRVLDPRTLVVTGLTRNGAWLVENGQVVHPVRNFRFTQAYPQALGEGNVLGVGAEVVPLPNRNELVNTSAPALHLASWNFTGGASG